eukprot:TRINITY_DN9904_c0_g1_i2.p1 TRINITY_DN9904_c0_g1~~TRINITY_DN9904_c0_g1_i2.p1  ORF type:complete len:636 (+),score=152.78 TRINITY_DN9904_c0_g1_i2:111-1910(+)
MRAALRTATGVRVPPATRAGVRHMSFLSREASTGHADANRWMMIPAVMGIQLSIGSMYAWSIFNNPLCRELGVIAPSASDWCMTDIVPVFSTTACFFGLTCLLTPPWQERVGPRKTCFLATGCWAGGLAVAAIGTSMHSLPVLYLGYGVLGGLGFGFGYITPTVNLIKWFPDKKGVATGLSVSGFAGGAVVGAPLNEYLFRMHFVPPTQVGTVGSTDIVLSGGKRMVEHAGEMKEVVVATAHQADSFAGIVENGVYLVGTGSTGVASTFATLSALYACMMTCGTFAQRVPPPGYIPPPLRLAQAAAGEPKPAEAVAATPVKEERTADHYVPLDRIMKSPQFYLFWTATGGNAFAGVTIISAAKNIVAETFSPAMSSLVTPGFAASYVVGLAVGNVGGRLLWSSLSDVVGRRNIFLMFGLVGVPTVASLPALTRMVTEEPSAFPVYAFCGGSALLVSFYGASTAILPAYIADTFGLKNTTTIFGRCLTGWATAALIGPIAMSKLRMASYNSELHALAATVDPAVFRERFGADISELDALSAAKTVDIQTLVEIAPPGTVDPSATLYDSSLYMMACALTVAFVCNFFIRPMEEKHFVTDKK